MIPVKFKFRWLQVSLLVMIFCNSSIVGQEAADVDKPERIMGAVYNDVWLPFMESYRELNIEKFKSIQANDLTKVAIDRNTIQTKAQYFGEIEGFFKQIEQSKRQMDISFSILSTATGKDKIYQTGYYRIGLRVSDSESYQPVGYGYFTVVIEKENDRWKLSLDADKKAVINEEEFRKSDVIYELD